MLVIASSEGDAASSTDGPAHAVIAMPRPTTETKDAKTEERGKSRMGSIISKMWAAHLHASSRGKAVLLVRISGSALALRRSRQTTHEPRMVGG